MKKIFVLFAMITFLMPAFAYNIPNGKAINNDAVVKGINVYSKKIEANPTSEDAYINRAFLYLLLDNLDLAISDYDKLIELNPNNEEFYLNRGYLKHIAHKREEALKDYNMALKINPNYAFAYNNRGVALSELGRLEESLNAYNAAIKINPNYADAYYNRGNLNVKSEKNQDALNDFNTAIKLNPSDSASFNNRGVVKRKLNYNVGALSDFSIAIKLNPDDITAFANRGRLKKRFYDSEGAEEDFKNAIAIAEESPIIIKQIELQAEIASNKKSDNFETEIKQPKISSENVQKISYKPTSNNTTENIKVATVRTGVLKVDPKTTKTTEISNTNLTNQQPEILTKPVENPKLAECYYIRALQKYILQNRESALKDFNTAIKYNSNYAEAYYYRAAIKRDLKDSGFVEDYQKAIKLNPALKSVDDADVLMILKI